MAKCLLGSKANIRRQRLHFCFFATSATSRQSATGHKQTQSRGHPLCAHHFFPRKQRIRRSRLMSVSARFSLFQALSCCKLGKYWARPRIDKNPKRRLTNNNSGKLFTGARPVHISKSGKALLGRRRARLHEIVETVSLQISSPREVLGWGSVGADQRTCPMDRIKDPTRASSGQRAGAVSLEQCSGPSSILASNASLSFESEA